VSNPFPICERRVNRWVADSVSCVSGSSGPVVLFDGVCNLCSGVVTALLRVDRRKALRFASLQSEFGRQVIERHGLRKVDSVLLLDGDRVHVESDALIAIGRALGGVWRLAILGRVVPRPLRDGLYRWVARHRIGWFGQRDSCLMPTPELRSRFVE
jgi:predicted DCC family thiol-disulfide oxidoreductase YuxK